MEQSVETCIITSEEHFGGNVDMEASMVETYAKGYGLVRKERVSALNNGAPEIYELYAIYSSEEFEKIAQEALSEEYIALPEK